MSKLNTLFNASSALSNRRSARNTAATSAAVGRLADADRHRELRSRGLITDQSTPADVDAVEHRLEAQMRARQALQGHRPPNSRRTALAASTALAVLVTLVVAAQFNPTGGQLWFLVAVAAGVVIAVGVFRFRRSDQRRDGVLAAADWCEDGTCGWCGTTEPHVVDGQVEHPRVAHAVEIEQELSRVR